MDAVDVDVKLILYRMLAQIDDDASYKGIRHQIDEMYDEDSSSDSNCDDDDFVESQGNSSNHKDLPEIMDSNCGDADSDVLEIDNDKDESDPEDDIEMVTETVLVNAKTKGELTIEDLPPIDQLAITPDSSLEQIGEVSSVLDKIVVVKANRFTPALDMDTVLFLENGQSIGPIFETFGPVVEPFYLIRFNSIDQISQLFLSENVGVYFLPHSARYTRYVFTDRLRTVKGSDASWEDNNEPPPECLDYSDDEEERRCKVALESEKRRNQYAHFLPPEDRRMNGEEGISSSFTGSRLALPPSVNCDAAMFSYTLPSKEIDRKAKLRSKLVGAALVRARRKAARTNLNDIPSSTQSASSGIDSVNNNNVLSLVEEAVKTNPSLLSSIISSALTAASNSQQQSGGVMPMALPVMLPPSADAPNQPRFLPIVSTALPANLQLQSPAAQNVVSPSTLTAESQKRRLIDPRFVKKQI